MYGRLAAAMSTAVSRRHGTPDGKDCDNEPMWSLELALSWARLDAACISHDLAESEPLITTALVMLPPQRPTGACADSVAEARSNNEQIARSLDGLPSLVPFTAFATDIFTKLQADITERVNLLRFAKLAPRFLTALGRSLGVLYLVSATPLFSFGPAYFGSPWQAP
jgi:hypothetical protein